MTRTRAHFLIAALLQLAACSLVCAGANAQPAIRVALVPKAAQELSGIAWRALTEECTAIWAREGIALSWSGATPDADVVLPLIFDDREVRRHDHGSDDAFGVTLFHGRSQRIVVSTGRAREVVALRRGLADSSDAMALDVAMGRLLGRVVAHEIGHALLLTTVHAAAGLMHPRLDATDLRPALDGQFALSDQDRGRLAIRFSNISPSAPRVVDVAELTSTKGLPVPSRLRARR